MDAMPPNRLVPPSTTAEIAWRLSVWWPTTLVPALRARSMTAAMPDQHALEHEQAQRVAVDVDRPPGPPPPGRADGERAHPEARGAQDHHITAAHHEGRAQRQRQQAEQPVAAERVWIWSGRTATFAALVRMSAMP